MKMNKNRYGDEWYWEKIAENQYKFHMSGDSMKYCRYGGKRKGGIHLHDLGMFDPSGGPYISARDEYAGSYIEGKEIIRLAKVNEHFIATVEARDDVVEL